MNKNALIIVDVQNDFCPSGSLEVKEGDKIIPIINKIAAKFFKVIATQDWHPENHLSFAKNHNKKVFETIKIGKITQVLWPEHCVQGTKGAEFHKDLDLSSVDLIIRKGTTPNIDSYSAFLENDKKTETGLHYYLKGLKIEKVYLCGLATDYCVYFSALDAKNLGFDAYVVLDASKGVDFPQGSIQQAILDMQSKGIKVISYTEI